MTITNTTDPGCADGAADEIVRSPCFAAIVLVTAGRRSRSASSHAHLIGPLSPSSAQTLPVSRAIGLVVVHARRLTGRTRPVRKESAADCASAAIGLRCSTWRSWPGRA